MRHAYDDVDSGENSSSLLFRLLLRYPSVFLELDFRDGRIIVCLFSDAFTYDSC